MSSKSGLPRSNRYRGAQKRVFAVFIAALGRGRDAKQNCQSRRLVVKQRFPSEGVTPPARIDRIAAMESQSKLVTCYARGVKVSIVAGQSVSKDAVLRQCNGTASATVAKTYRSL